MQWGEKFVNWLPVLNDWEEYWPSPPAHWIALKAVELNVARCVQLVSYRSYFGIHDQWFNYSPKMYNVKYQSHNSRNGRKYNGWLWMKGNFYCTWVKCQLAIKVISIHHTSQGKKSRTLIVYQTYVFKEKITFYLILADIWGCSE